MDDRVVRNAVKSWFYSRGLSISDWATQNGFKRDQVYSFLNGRTSGRRGMAHAIAVELGLKTESALPLQMAHLHESVAAIESNVEATLGKASR